MPAESFLPICFFSSMFNMYFVVHTESIYNNVTRLRYPLLTASFFYFFLVASVWLQHFYNVVYEVWTINSFATCMRFCCLSYGFFYQQAYPTTATTKYRLQFINERYFATLLLFSSIKFVSSLFFSTFYLSIHLRIWIFSNPDAMKRVVTK